MFLRWETPEWVIKSSNNLCKADDHSQEHIYTAVVCACLPFQQLFQRHPPGTVCHSLRTALKNISEIEGCKFLSIYNEITLFRY